LSNLSISAVDRLAVTFGMQSTALSNLTVRVLLFASYAEALGLDSTELTFAGNATVGDVINRLRALPAGNLLPAKPFCAVNLKQVNPSTPLKNGDELALLPPMAGG
jgi:molybdopterin converting factor small subunit